MIWLDVLVRALQRKRTNNTYVGIDKEIYYKRLAHMTVEARKSCDLLYSGWRPRRV
jgi:hypothetical protein